MHGTSQAEMTFIKKTPRPFIALLLLLILKGSRDLSNKMLLFINFFSIYLMALWSNKTKQ